MTRIYLVKGIGPVLRIVEGSFKDVYSVMANWGTNHGAVCYCRDAAPPAPLIHPRREFMQSELRLGMNLGYGNLYPAPGRNRSEHCPSLAGLFQSILILLLRPAGGASCSLRIQAAKLDCTSLSCRTGRILAFGAGGHGFVDKKGEASSAHGPDIARPVRVVLHRGA